MSNTPIGGSDLKAFWPVLDHECVCGCVCLTVPLIHRCHRSVRLSDEILVQADLICHMSLAGSPFCHLERLC